MKTRIVRLLFFSLILLFVAVLSAGGMGKNSDLPQVIFKHWTHSYEEDTKDVKVFRPSHYDFPRARGRGGFEIKKNGEFVQYRIGRTDRIERSSGHWKAGSKGKIIVYLKTDNGIVSYTINIVSCSREILRIKIELRKN